MKNSKQKMQKKKIITIKPKKQKQNEKLRTKKGLLTNNFRHAYNGQY